MLSTKFLGDFDTRSIFCGIHDDLATMIKKSLSDESMSVTVVPSIKSKSFRHSAPIMINLYLLSNQSSNLLSFNDLTVARGTTRIAELCGAFVADVVAFLVHYTGNLVVVTTGNNKVVQRLK